VELGAEGGGVAAGDWVDAPPPVVAGGEGVAPVPDAELVPREAWLRDTGAARSPESLSGGPSLATGIAAWVVVD
jgi:hypothetical protein